MFSDYQMQEMSENFIDSFGFQEDEFTESEENVRCGGAGCAVLCSAQCSSSIWCLCKFATNAADLQRNTQQKYPIAHPLPAGG